MLTTKEKQPATRTLRGWAISILQEANAIRECEELDARSAAGISPDAAAAEVQEVLVSI